MQDNSNMETGNTDLFGNNEEDKKELYAFQVKKVRNKLLTVAAVIFFFDLLALLMADLLTPETLAISAVVPAIVVGLAFLGLKEPILAVVIASVIIIGIWVYIVVMTDISMAIQGFLAKILVITLLLTAFQNAKEARRIDKEFGL